MPDHDMRSGASPLSGKAVVITGAGRGIGASCAELACALGADVVIADIDRDVLESVASKIRERGGSVHASVADVTDINDAQRIVAACVERFGHIDGLVNNAALHAQEWFWDMDPAWSRRMVDVNVLGPIYCAHAAALAMRERGGAIVNMTSGSQSGLPAWSAYGATKGAVASLTYSLAMELGDAGIRVNAVSPMAATRMSDPAPGFAPAAPIGHTTFPPASNNAAVVAFLLSDHSAPLTGQVVRIDADGISLMTHPAILNESFRAGSDWSFSDVQHLFETGLATLSQPLGIVRQ
jgi:NAD(P)-dependent dehydrogenase (short-subunit alcohol dehydrogenase family)